MDQIDGKRLKSGLRDKSCLGKSLGKGEKGEKVDRYAKIPTAVLPQKSQIQLSCPASEFAVSATLLMPVLACG